MEAYAQLFCFLSIFSEKMVSKCLNVCNAKDIRIVRNFFLKESSLDENSSNEEEYVTNDKRIQNRKKEANRVMMTMNIMKQIIIKQFK